MYTADDTKHLAADKMLHMQVYDRELFNKLLFLHLCSVPWAAIHAWVEGPNLEPMPPGGAGIPEALESRGDPDNLRASQQFASPITSLQRHRLYLEFISEELNTVRHAMLTLWTTVMNREQRFIITELALAHSMLLKCDETW